MKSIINRLAANADICRLSANHSEADDASLLKFAKGVVQECMDRLSAELVGDERNADHDVGLINAIVILKEHFRITETKQ